MLVVKALHILAAVLFFGAGAMTAYYKLRADRSGDVTIIAWCLAEIVQADWRFTVPSGIVLPLTGMWLVNAYGLPWTTPWVLIGVAGFAVAGALWVPAAVLQLRMRDWAIQALQRAEPLPEAYHRASRIWLALGVPAFLAALLAIYAMVVKPG